MNAFAVPTQKASAASPMRAQHADRMAAIIRGTTLRTCIGRAASSHDGPGALDSYTRAMWSTVFLTSRKYARIVVSRCGIGVSSSLQCDSPLEENANID